MTWVTDPPTMPGWYGTLHDRNEHEGGPFAGHYWNGTEWASCDAPVIARSPEPLPGRNEAVAWACAAGMP